MRLLCDQNVADEYYQTFKRTDWISVRRLGDVLPVEASDPDIIEYAAENDWVVFTSDVRFLAENEEGDSEQIDLEGAECGILFYRQVDNPSPGDVISALQKIERSYVDHSEIREYVPGAWIPE